jgi:hypothetical protein
MPGPILVTGSHRSGTTWVGRMLTLAPGLAYVHEPFNVGRWPGWMRSRLPHWYLYVCEENEGAYAPLLQDVLRFRYPIRNIVGARHPRQVGRMLAEWPRSVWYRSRGMRPVLKDPIALLSAEWLARRFGAEVVVMIRHPAAFAGSLKRLGWGFDFKNWADQPLFLRDLAGPYERQIRDYASHERDLIDQSVLMWNVIHHVVRGYRERHPEWIFLRHEDLAEEPVAGFRRLYGRLGLPWDQGVEDAIARSSTGRWRGEVPRVLHRTVHRDSRSARWTWLRRLSREERERIRAGTADVAGDFYSDEDWVPVESA